MATGVGSRIDQDLFFSENSTSHSTSHGGVRGVRFPAGSFWERIKLDLRQIGLY